jgi:serine/threonine protein kinase
MPREKPLTVDTELTGRYTYRIRRLVGGGGMAWVYQVERLDAGHTSLWALKELRPQTQDPDTQKHARRLFDQEASILSRLDHPNLPQVIDFFEEDGRAYLVMEFVWGESLEKRLEQARSPLMERQVLQWAIQICEVLDYLHSRQPPVIFRDLKPSNVMVNNAGVVKLVDFGIARTYKEDKLQDTIALGSENYAAPEQWGQAQTDPRSDIYGLGATMYHLLANMPPSPAFLPAEPTPLDALNSALSPETVEIVTRAMARDRDARYQSANEMKEALAACLPDYASSEQTKVTPRTPEKIVPPTNQPTEASVTVTQIKPVTRRRVRKLKVCPRCEHRNELANRFCVRCGYSFVGVRPAVLRVVEPVRAAWEMPIAKSPMLFGRAQPQSGYRPDFDMSFYDPEGYISRRHGQIIKARNGYFVIDLGSSNGTYVNDQLLSPHKPRLLRNGDKITIGEVLIQFLLR